MSEEPKKKIVVPTELPGNSYNKAAKAQSKEEEKDRPEIKPVIQGEAIRRKKGFGSKIRETFTGDDSRTVGNYILFEVFIPALKTMISDATKEATDRLLFGSDSRRVSKSRDREGTYTPYGKMYNNGPSRAPQRDLSSRARSQHDFDEIILGSRGEAEEVLDQLGVLVDDYGHAKVSDLYSMVGITGSYIDDRWGWTDLRSATTSRVRQGYLLDLPAPINLK